MSRSRSVSKADQEFNSFKGKFENKFLSQTPLRTRNMDLTSIQKKWNDSIKSVKPDQINHETKNETEALLLEGKLIKEYKPRYNTDFTDDKQFLCFYFWGPLNL